MSCLQWLAPGGKLGAVPLQPGLLELCGFAPSEDSPPCQAVPCEEWLCEGRLAHVVAAPLEPLMVEVAIRYLTPARFMRNVLVDLVNQPDTTCRGTLLDVAVAYQICMLSAGRQKVGKWLRRLCKCKSADMPDWLGKHIRFSFHAAAQGTASLCRYFASIPCDLEGVVSETLLKTLPRVPPCPNQVDEVRSPLIISYCPVKALVRPENVAGSDLVDTWTSHSGAPLFISFSNAWYTDGVDSDKDEQEPNANLLLQYSQGNVTLWYFAY
jgi:hypothetical protein